MRFRIAWLFLALATSAWARGGGGCLEHGTLIATPDGWRAIESLAVGDTVLAAGDDRLAPAKVQACLRVEPEWFVELVVGGRTVRATPEHPFQVGPGEFRTADTLRAGDELCLWDEGVMQRVPLKNIRRVPAAQPAFNLLVSPGGTFLANGLTVHNKGCFLPDTPILRSDGTERRISEIRSGEEVLAFTPEGAVVFTRVERVLTHEVEEYWIVRTEQRILRVTAEHPFYVGAGTFKTLAVLRLGDKVFAYDGQGLSAQRIVSLERIQSHTTVFNLQTGSPHTFFADGLAVHNKGGCFPAGTPVRTPTGDTAIEKLAPGDAVLAVDERGRSVHTTVESVHSTRSPLLVLQTSCGALRTTPEHPLLRADGQFRAAGELFAGDQIQTWQNGRMCPTVIRQSQFTADEQTVFNLRVGEPHTFIADGFVVHNKGGGFSGGSFHGSSTGSSDPEAVIFAVVFLLVFLVIIPIINARKRANQDLDFAYSRSDIAKKAAKTSKLLEFIARVDQTMKPQALEAMARTTFLQLQQCWQARQYEPMKLLLMPDLYAEHVQQLAGLVRNHEINNIADLSVEATDLVNVRYTHKEDQREFTALITARAKDFYIDDRTREFLRGDKEPARFQEFWTFQRLKGTWLLREIEQTRESDVLKDDNFFEPFTDMGVDQVYGEAARKEGPAGPWLDDATEGKGRRTERLLNFLAMTDKLWTRQDMLNRAREIFTEVLLAREAGDPAGVPAASLFPDTAEHLRQEIARQREQGLTVEYRNFCVRKVEIVLVHNFADNTRDEFTARFGAHAQRITRQNGAVISQDEDVSPFEEYWTFGRLENIWKLKEVQPAARGEQMISEENVDEGSSPQQLQWYYKQTRAN